MAKHKFKENDIVKFKTPPKANQPGMTLKHALLHRRYTMFQIITLRDSDCLVVPYPSNLSKENNEKILGLWVSYNKLNYLGNVKTNPIFDILYKK